MVYKVGLKPKATKAKNRDALDDYEDLKDLRMAKEQEKSAPVSPLTDVRAELNI